MKQPSWIKDAYKGTLIHWSKTQSQIYQRLGELGIYEIRFTNLKERFALEFLVSLPNEQKPRAVRIVVPLKVNSSDENKRTQELNIIHRVLLNHIKAKFVAIGSGLTEFEEEFMAHLVITDKDGNSTTIGEMLLPQYKENLESGKQKDFKLLDDGK